MDVCTMQQQAVRMQHRRHAHAHAQAGGERQEVVSVGNKRQTAGRKR